MNGALPEYNEFLLQLYSAAERCSPGEFQNESLENLARLLPADCAAWGGGYAAERNITDLMVWNADECIMTDWHQVREVDLMCDLNLGRMGEVHFIDEIPNYRNTLAFNEHWRVHNIHQLMATIINEPQSNYVSFIALCHTDPNYPFTLHSQRVKQDLLPHLIQAQRHNQRIYLDRLANPSTAVAMVTAGGLVQTSQPCFDEMACDQWRDASRVPESIMKVLRDIGHWQSPDMEITARSLGGAYLVRMEPGHTLNALSPRERQVAELYAQGLNYREIANELERSPATVRNLLARCYQKLDVHDKVALIRRLSPSA
jgi:DNA-binding NarL/FixJ family response regulator